MTTGDDPVARRRQEQAMIEETTGTLRRQLDALEDASATPSPADPAAARAAAPFAATRPAPAAPAVGRPSRLPRVRSRAATVQRLSAPGWTPAVQRAFVEHLAVHGCVDQAARHVGLSRQSAYQLRQRLPNSMFALAWETAMMLARRSLIDIAIERAINGREEEVWSRGEMVGTRVVHNDRMLMFVIGHKSEPLHPNLTNPELHQLWPNMLDDIDAILPPVLSKADAKAKIADHADYGNDQG